MDATTGKEYVLAIDNGTTSTRCIAFKKDGTMALDKDGKVSTLLHCKPSAPSCARRVSDTSSSTETLSPTSAFHCRSL